MSTNVLSDEEATKQGNLVYSQVRSQIEPGNLGKFIAIDLVTGKYRIDSTHSGAIDKMLADLPNADIYTKRIGYDTAVVMGASWHRDEHK